MGMKNLGLIFLLVSSCGLNSAPDAASRARDMAKSLNGVSTSSQTESSKDQPSDPSQNLDPQNVNKTEASKYYFLGSGIDSTVGFVTGYWKAGKWSQLPRVNQNSSYYGSAIFVSGEDLYISATAINKAENSKRSIGYYKNTTWIALETPGTDPTASSLYISGPDIHVVGSYFSGSTPRQIAAYWKNGKIVNLPMINSQRPSSAVKVLIDGDDVYVAGNQHNEANIPVAGYWKNNQWVGLPSNYRCAATTMGLSGLDVFVVGKCESGDFKTGITNYVGFWKNGVWVELKSLDPKQPNTPTCVAFEGSSVYIGGYAIDSSKVKKVRKAGYWKDGNWMALMSPSPSKDSDVTFISAAGGNVIAAGHAYPNTPSNSVAVPGRWENGQWTPEPIPEAVRSMRIIDGAK